MKSNTAFTIQTIDAKLHPFIQPLVDEAWSGPWLVINGKRWDTRILPGLAALDANGMVIGYLLYAMHDGLCEIMALESLRQGIGVGTKLVQQVIVIAGNQGIQKVAVMTTNDNLHALRFYQKHGFVLQELRKGIVSTSRTLKPEIPQNGIDGIPIRDEIELLFTIR